MPTKKIVDGITYQELSQEELELGLFHLAGEDLQRAIELMKALKEAVVEEVVSTANAKNEGKTWTQIALDRIARREKRRHMRKMRANVRKADITKPQNIALHHVVSWHAILAEQARAILKQFGIDIDDACNAVFLPRDSTCVPHKDMPNAPAHTKVHTEIYYANITALLTAVADNPQTTRDDLVALLRDIAKQLTEGTFPINDLIN